MVKQTAGRDALNDFAPKFAALNDDVLFGEVWSREGQLPLKLRSIVTITALISKGITDSSLTYHLTTAKQNGVTKTEMAELPHAPRLLRRLAERLGRLPAGEGGLRRRERGRKRRPLRPRRSEHGLRAVLHRRELPQPADRPDEDRFPRKRHLLPCLPQQLAHPPREVRRRPAAAVHGWSGLVSGGGQARTGPAPRRRGDHPGRGQALARRAEGLLVQPHRHRMPRRGDEQRVAGASHGRGIRSARRRLCTNPVNYGFPAHIFCIPPLVLPPTAVV